MRAIGRLEKTDWNMAAIERKIEENPRAATSGEAERVPKWNRDAYDEKVNIYSFISLVTNLYCFPRVQCNLHKHEMYPWEGKKIQ